ncbi:hypothetical protein Pcinc_042689, partial [Petrolisthes cinctipes]
MKRGWLVGSMGSRGKAEVEGRHGLKEFVGWDGLGMRRRGPDIDGNDKRMMMLM